jgi:hypothetical protein
MDIILGANHCHHLRQVSSAWFGISAGGRRYFGEILRTGLTLAHEAQIAVMNGR